MGNFELRDRRYVFFILQSETNDRGEFNALIAVEGERGFFKTDWFWGKDLKVAEQIADERNEAIGIDKKEAWKIVAGTMDTLQEGAR